MRDVACRVSERPTIGAQRKAAELSFSRRHLPNWSSRRCHAEQMDVAVRLGVEVDRLPVGGPGGTAGIETPVGRQGARCSAARTDDAHLVLLAAPCRADE